MAIEAKVSILFGRRLRNVRKLRQLTQDELGHRAQVTGKTIGEIERGIGNPTLALIGRLANALHVPANELFLFEGGIENTPRTAAPTALADRVASYISGRPRADVSRALRILEVALESVPSAKTVPRGNTAHE